MPLCSERDKNPDGGVLILDLLYWHILDIAVVKFFFEPMRQPSVVAFLDDDGFHQVNIE